MKNQTKTMFGIFLVLTMLLSTTSSVQAAEWPEWIPTEEDITGYNILFENSTSVENFMCPDAENQTIYSQLWYKNNTDDETVAFISQGYIELEEDYFGDKFGATERLALSFAGFSDIETRWDLFVAIMNMSGVATEIEIDGWDRAIEFNTTDTNFQYMITGTIGNRLIVSFALEVDSFYWWGLTEMDLAWIISVIMVGWVSIVTIFATLGGECPESSSAPVVPTSEEDYTPKEDMIEFNTKIGEVLAEKGIDGFAPLVLMVCSTITVFAIVKKYRK